MHRTLQPVHRLEDDVGRKTFPVHRQLQSVLRLFPSVLRKSFYGCRKSFPVSGMLEPDRITFEPEQRMKRPDDRNHRNTVKNPRNRHKTALSVAIPSPDGQTLLLHRRQGASLRARRFPWQGESVLCTPFRFAGRGARGATRPTAAWTTTAQSKTPLDLAQPGI